MYMFTYAGMYTFIGAVHTRMFINGNYVCRLLYDCCSDLFIELKC